MPFPASTGKFHTAETGGVPASNAIVMEALVTGFSRAEGDQNSLVTVSVTLRPSGTAADPPKYQPLNE